VGEVMMIGVITGVMPVAVAARLGRDRRNGDETHDYGEYGRERSRLRQSMQQTRFSHLQTPLATQAHKTDGRQNATIR
jgi:hypothetical protein